MEFKEIIKIIKMNRTVLVIFALVGSLLGTALSFVPGKYRVEGSFFIGRKADVPSTEFFTYEGYYAQQTAQSYTNTAVALLESQDLKKAVLEQMEIPVTDNNVRKLTKSFRISKIGPQVITLTVRNPEENKSEEIFKTLASNFLNMGEKISAESDENISVIPISEFPVKRQEQMPLIPCVMWGFMVGITAAILKISIKEYMK